MSEKSTLHIEGEIRPQDPFFEMFGADMPSASAKMVTKWLDENDAEEIEVVIDSLGGSVNEAFKIIDILNDSGRKITTKGYQVASAATCLFLIGEERLLSEHSMFLIHSPMFPMSSFFSKETWNEEELEEMQEALRDAKDKVLNFYVEKLGDDKRQEIEDLMAQDIDMGVDKAIELGFATGRTSDKTEKKEDANAVFYSDQVINLIKNHNKMAKEEKSFWERMEARFDEVISKLNPKPQDIKNVVLKSEDGSTSIYVEEGEGGALVGQTAYLADADGNKTEDVAPKDEYTLDDGRTLVVGEEGKVEEVKEADGGDTVENLQAQLADLKNQNKELQTKLDAKSQEVEAKDKQLIEVTKDVNDLKEQMQLVKMFVPGDPKGANGNAGRHQSQPDEKLTDRQRGIRNTMGASKLK